MDVDLLLVPYDSGHRGARMGAGPERLVVAGLPARIEGHGHRLRRAVVEAPEDAWSAEIRSAFDLAAALAARVAAARAGGRLPVVLSGNCIAAVGVVAGLGRGAAVLWCDAHGDFNTPETTTGGFLDGMALAAVAGRCWTAMTGRVPGFAPVPESRLWLAGARDLDPLERAALDRSAVRRVPAAAIGASLAAEVCASVGDAPLYLHVDLDVLDPSEGRANSYAAPGGATAAALAALCASLAASGSLSAVTMSAYDPAADADGRLGDAALRIVDALFGALPASSLTSLEPGSA